MRWWFGDDLGPNGALSWGAEPALIGLALTLAVFS